MNVSAYAVIVADDPNEPLKMIMELEQGTAEDVPSDNSVMAAPDPSVVQFPRVTLAPIVEREKNEVTRIGPSSTTDVGHPDEKSELDVTLAADSKTGAPVKFTHRAAMEVSCSVYGNNKSFWILTLKLIPDIKSEFPRYAAMLTEPLRERKAISTATAPLPEKVIGGRYTDPYVVATKLTTCCCVTTVLMPPKTMSWLKELPAENIVNVDALASMLTTFGNS